MSCRSCGTGVFPSGVQDMSNMSRIQQNSSVVRSRQVGGQVGGQAGRQVNGQAGRQVSRQVNQGSNQAVIRRNLVPGQPPTILAVVPGPAAADPADLATEILDSSLYFIENQGFVMQFVLDGSCGGCPSGVSGCHCMVVGPCGSGGVPKSVGTRLEATDGNNFIQMEILVLQRTSGTNTFQEMPSGTPLQVGQYFAVSFVDVSVTPNIRYYWQASNSSDNIFLIPSTGGTPFDGTASAPYRVFVLVDIGVNMTGKYDGTENIGDYADNTLPYWIQSVGRYDDKKQYYLVEGQGSGTNCTVTIHEKKNMANPTLGANDDLLSNVSYPMTFIPAVVVPLDPGRSVALPTGMQWWQWMFVGVAVYAAIVIAIIVVLIIMKVV